MDQHSNVGGEEPHAPITSWESPYQLELGGEIYGVTAPDHVNDLTSQDLLHLAHKHYVAQPGARCN